MKLSRTIINKCNVDMALKVVIFILVIVKTRRINTQM